MQIKSVGIIGAGQMGAGIAHVVALHGYDVLIHDISADRLAASLENVRKNMARQVAKGAIEQGAMDKAMARVKTSTKLGDAGQTDLAIEAATENEEVKKSIFRELTPLLGPDTIVAS